MNRTSIKSVILIASVMALGGISFIVFNSSVQTTVLENNDENENPNDPKTSATGRVIIYVNSTIYRADNISSEVNQYAQDILNNNSYTVKIINNTMFMTPEALKANLTAEYNAGGLTLKGAVLIGEFPYIWYDQYNNLDQWGKYPCDLFLMDMNGLWADANPLDGTYDDHWILTPGVETLPPEIFVARINPLPLTGINQTKELKDYFKRNHDYRTGKLSRPDKGLLYLDDEWARVGWIPGWTDWFTLYSGANRIVYSDNASTTPTNYKNNLTLNYEWVQLLVHSNETDHLFGMVLPGTPTAVEGTFDTATLNALNTQPLFYNMYACYNGNYTHGDSLGTQYLFSNNTLAVLCSSRAGGMDLYKYFYDPLKNGGTIGDSFVTWFNDQDPLITTPVTGKLESRVWHGMTILGDPLLTVKTPSAGGGTVATGGGGGGGGDSAAVIPFGSYYLVFTVFTIISLILLKKRKTFFTKNN